jgi:hypothetical protein
MDGSDTEARSVIEDVRTGIGESLEDRGGFGQFLRSWVGYLGGLEEEWTNPGYRSWAWVDIVQPLWVRWSLVCNVVMSVLVKTRRRF